jgi:type IV pilus assembly protein PilV
MNTPARHPLHRRASRARGFSLIEVLVSIFIVSLGILALGGLLQSASRFGKMSEMRSTAALLANDISDRIRANPNATTSDYTIGVGGYPTNVAPDATDCTPAYHCSPSELAKKDMEVWTKRLRSMLPDGSAYIEFNAANGTSKGAFDVWVAWTDPATVKTGGTTERSATECPDDWAGASDNTAVRCVYLQVGL